MDDSTLVLHGKETQVTPIKINVVYLYRGHLCFSCLNYLLFFICSSSFNTFEGSLLDLLLVSGFIQEV